MDSISMLPNVALHAGGMSDAFLARGITTFWGACHWVKALPYGSNSRVDEATVLFEDGRGTCVTKHGAIAKLAAELGLDVHKNLAFYRLTEDIVTGVGDILRPYGLDFAPTVHCFLEHGSCRVDLTEGNRTGKNKDLEQFDFVVRVEPESSRAELQRQYSAHFAKYAAIEPRLAALGEATVRELVRKCHRQAACRRAASADLSRAAVALS
jgi:hypothetical protein